MSNSVRAIVFSGGGAYGAYEVGVLKALAERPDWTWPQVVTGASAGAFNAALLAAAYDGDLRQAAQRIEEIWLQRIPGHVFRVRADPRALLDFAPAGYVAATGRWIGDIGSLSADFMRRLARVGLVGPFDERLLQLVDLASFISVAPLERLLGEIVRPGKLRDSPVRLSIIATNWETGEMHVFRKPDMTDADAVSILLASAAIPGFFPPRKVGTQLFVDGGLVMNTPLKPAIDDGADEIHIIYLDPNVKEMPILKLQNTFDTLDRVLAINTAFHINSDIQTARQVNRAIELFEQAGGVEEAARGSELAAVASRWRRVRSEPRPRKLAIHRYHPRRDLGGLLGLLRFEKDAIQELINTGYQDTIRHDCSESDCESAAASVTAADLKKAAAP
jgi:NTE family protein